MAQMVKASACNTGDPGSIPGYGRSSGEGNGNPLQFSCLENSMDGEILGYSSWGRKESDMTEQFHFHLHNLLILFSFSPQPTWPKLSPHLCNTFQPTLFKLSPPSSNILLISSPRSVLPITRPFSMLSDKNIKFRS